MRQMTQWRAMAQELAQYGITKMQNLPSFRSMPEFGMLFAYLVDIDNK